jgi:transketolase
MNAEETGMLKKAANAVRAISADAIERQQSGHPGMCLGAADVGAYLFAKVLRYNPRNPSWPGRDRFILSAGHGSMLQYALLHLSGFDLTIEDILHFRELHSRTPGHPEFGVTPGIEITTGPLGQGVAAGLGMAIAQKFLAARFGVELFDYKIWVLAGDGCLMEGISSEASSLAGTLGLDNFVLLYDCNRVSLDGPTSEAFQEDVAARYRAYGFNVLEIDGYDYAQMEEAFTRARLESRAPTLIIIHTVIGLGAPGKQGTSAAHGGPLGPADLRALKHAIGWPEEPLFHVPADVYEYFRSRLPGCEGLEAEWKSRLEAMRASQPRKAELWDLCERRALPPDFARQVWDMEIQPDQSSRKYSELILNRIGRLLPYLISGSADLSSCDFTWLKYGGIASRGQWDQQQVKFGVREFCMAAAAYGMQLHGMVQPLVGTFLTFSDYMRNAVRLAALMRQRVLFVFSHDSIQIGQDGPTHQPVEHLMSLRLIPNFTLIRPGDENEVKAAYIAAFQAQDGPVGICLTRNPFKSTVSDLTAARAREGVARGAYVLWGEARAGRDVLIIATGTEIHPAVGAARILEREGKRVRVVSMPSWELFDAQDERYRKSVLGGRYALRVSVEAGRSLGWQKYIGADGLAIALDTWGASASMEVLLDHYGFTAEKVAARILDTLAGKPRK